MSTIQRIRRAVLGMTLIEMLTVIAIIGILAALLIPAISGARESGRIAFCAGNLRNLGQGLNMYTDEHDDYLPAVSADGNTLMWDTELLPYVGDSYDVFLCPTDREREDGVTNPPRSYAANGGVTYTINSPPFGLYNGTPMRMGNFDYAIGDVILVGERPTATNSAGVYDVSVQSSRGYIGQYDFCGMNEEHAVMHRKNRGGNYLMASMAVQFYDRDNTNLVTYWTVQTK